MVDLRIPRRCFGKGVNKLHGAASVAINGREFMIDIFHVVISLVHVV